MTTSDRVKRWRDSKRQDGQKGVMVWLTTSEELRLKDAAVQERCAPSDVMQRAFAQYQARTPSSISAVTDASLIREMIQDALAQWQPTSYQSSSNVTDVLLLREIIKAELAAMQNTVSSTDNVSVTVTDTVPDTVTDAVTDTPPPGQPASRPYGSLSHQVREAIARQRGAFTPATIAAACGVTSRDVWPYLKRGEQAGTLRREHAGKGAPYRRV